MRMKRRRTRTRTRKRGGAGGDGEAAAAAAAAAEGEAEGTAAGGAGPSAEAAVVEALQRVQVFEDPGVQEPEGEGEEAGEDGDFRTAWELLYGVRRLRVGEETGVQEPELRTSLISSSDGSDFYGSVLVVPGAALGRAATAVDAPRPPADIIEVPPSTGSELDESALGGYDHSEEPSLDGILHDLSLTVPPLAASVPETPSYPRYGEGEGRSLRAPHFAGRPSLGPTPQTAGSVRPLPIPRTSHTPTPHEAAEEDPGPPLFLLLLLLRPDAGAGPGTLRRPLGHLAPDTVERPAPLGVGPAAGASPPLKPAFEEEEEEGEGQCEGNSEAAGESAPSPPPWVPLLDTGMPSPRGGTAPDDPPPEAVRMRPLSLPPEPPLPHVFDRTADLSSELEATMTSLRWLSNSMQDEIARLCPVQSPSLVRTLRALSLQSPFPRMRVPSSAWISVPWRPVRLRL
eukprot:tig00000215_g18636.t1